VARESALSGKLEWLLAASANKFGRVYEHGEPLACALAPLGFTAVSARELVRELASSRRAELRDEVGGSWTEERRAELAGLLFEHVGAAAVFRDGKEGSALVCFERHQ
jgi:hypothetical protein